MTLPELLSLDPVRRALLAGALLAPIAGMMGSFVILRGLSFFGEAIAHSTFAAAGIALFLGVHPQLDPWSFLAVVVGFSLVGAALIDGLLSRPGMKGDVSIAIVFAAMVAVGMLVISASQKQNPSRMMMNLMFGGILTLDRADLIALGGLLAAFGAFLAWAKKPLVLLTLEPEYARALGVKTRLLSMIFLALLTILISLGVRMMGTLLISALLVIPAATARHFARGFSQMLALSSLAAFVSLEGGIVASGLRDLPTGPTVVLCAVALFTAGLAWSAIQRARRGRTPMNAEHHHHH